jgi:hypothetical protein
LARTHNNLGHLLSVAGRSAEAKVAFESAWAIQLKLADVHPESPEYAHDLGVTLDNLAGLDLLAQRFAEARDNYSEAIIWQKKAVAANPGHPSYRKGLTHHYMGLRQIAEGLKDADLSAEAEKGLAELEASDPRLHALDARLDDVLRGEGPKDNAERLALARRAYNTAKYATAAKLWAEALETDPKLAESRQDQLRYDATCAAAMAANGAGKDDPPPDDATRTRLREQALVWLRAELAAWADLVESGLPQARAFIVQSLEHWRKDTDLPSVRDPEALEKLPEDERQAWRELWDSVAETLTKAKDE